MTDVTAALARTITWASSKQTYYTARLMVDKDLVDDCYRGYAYFRWADDVIDICSQSDDERISFVKRQRELIDRLYRGERPDDLSHPDDPRCSSGHAGGLRRGRVSRRPFWSKGNRRGPVDGSTRRCLSRSSPRTRKKDQRLSTLSRAGEASKRNFRDSAG